MNQMFRDFGRGWGMESTGLDTGMFNPKVDVRETEKNIELSAELPGLKEDDIDLSVIRGGEAVLLKGDYHRTERAYGSFQRMIPLPARVDTDKCDATFKSGVLHVVLPKVNGEAGTRHIRVKSN